MAGRMIRFLTSVKLAAVLIGYLAVAGILSTLVPQGQPESFYRDRYPGAVADILIGSGFTSFFGSVPFILPSILFFANLSACTAGRLAAELRKKKGRRSGSVILHVGLMILVSGATYSFAARTDGIVFLAPGERAELPGNKTLTLLDFSFEKYPDGRPKEWTSTVRITRGAETEVESYALRVNKPLKTGSVTLYQASYGTEGVLTSGIRAVTDSGYPFALAGLLLAGSGICLTLFGKLGDMEP